MLAAAFLFLRAVDYWLGRYDLAVNFSGRFTGLNYTDAHATLTAKGILAGIALIVAALFIVGALVEGWWRSLPVYRRRRPARLRDPHRRHLPGDRPAFPGDAQRADAGGPLHPAQHRRHPRLLRPRRGEGHRLTAARREGAAQATKAAETAAPGIRLIDPSIVSDAFQQQQQISQYYTFQDNLDVDRYTLERAERSRTAWWRCAS